VFTAQPRQLDPLGAQFGVELAAQLARLVDVGLQLGHPLLGLPLVALARTHQIPRHDGRRSRPNSA